MKKLLTKAAVWAVAGGVMGAATLACAQESLMDKDVVAARHAAYHKNEMKKEAPAPKEEMAPKKSPKMYFPSRGTLFGNTSGP